MKHLLTVGAVVLGLAMPAAALGGVGGVQGAQLGQVNQATALAGTVVAVGGGGPCFAGCPTIVVAPATAVALGLNLALVFQVQT